MLLKRNEISMTLDARFSDARTLTDRYRNRMTTVHVPLWKRIIDWFLA